MSRQLIFPFIIILLISGCSFDAHIVTPAPAEPTFTPAPPLSFPPVETVPATVPVGDFTPMPDSTLFYAARAVLNPSAMKGRSMFPAGTKQIYVLWNYQNMHEGATIKREWYLDGQLWLTREEPWDYAKYAASGLMQDISIYDLTAGLPPGKYKLVVYIDGVAQPIGKKIVEGRAQDYLEFEVLPAVEVTSPDGQWKVKSLLDRLVLIDANGSQSDLATGHEIISVAWLDDRRLLFVDRDRSGQVAEPLIGVRDTLWLVDIAYWQSGALYQSETTLGSNGGMYVSPDGKHVAGIEGTGFGDACMLDSRVIFFEIAADYKSVKVIKQEQFAGLPASADGVVYPVAVGTWQSGMQYSVYLNGTCGIDPSLMGFYAFNLSTLNATLEAKPMSMGDLGWGDIHGTVTDAVTGKAIAGATVRCEHNSYSSPARCSGSVVTDASGNYVLSKVFFHDTDRIKLTVTAPGYQPQEFTQDSFTFNDMAVNFSLEPLP